MADQQLVLWQDALPLEVLMSLSGPSSSASASDDELQMDLGVLVQVLVLTDPSFLSMPLSPGRHGVLGAQQSHAMQTSRHIPQAQAEEAQAGQAQASQTHGEQR
jgi:hypothetical protein